MSGIIKGCLLYRLALAFQKWYAFSLIGRFFNFFKDNYQYSNARSAVKRIFGSPMTMTRNSWYYSRLEGINRFLHARHESITRVLHGSLIYRLYYRAANAKVSQTSIVCGLLFKSGFNRILIFLFALYLPMDYALRDVLSIPVLPSIWDELFLIVCVVYILARRVLGREFTMPRATPLDVPILLFFGVGLMLMGIVSPFPSIAVSGYRATVQYILWFFVLVRLFESDRDVTVFYYTFIAMGTLIALHGIYQYIIAVPIPPGWVTSTEAGVRTRVFSIFGSPNIMGDFMVLVAPMTAALAYRTEKLELKIAAWACTFLMCFACLFTFSRGAWLGLAAAVIVFALLNDRRLLALLAIAGGIAIFIPDVYNRISFLFTEQFAYASAKGGRASRWALGMLYLTVHSNPLFGFGLGMFGGAVAMQNKVYNWVSYFYMDNYYLKILVEMGYVGLIAFIIMLVVLAASSLRAIYRSRSKNGKFSPLCVGMFSGLCGVMTHCFYENIFEEPYMMAYFWGIAAVIAYLGFIRREESLQ